MSGRGDDLLRTVHRAIRRLAWLMLLPAGVAFSGERLLLPGWFWNPPAGDGFEAAVGYSHPYYTEQSSYREAFEDAARRLWADRDCRIAAAGGTATQGDRIMSMGGILRIEADTTGFAAYRAKLVRVDSAWTTELVVMLAATAPINVSPARIPSPGPDWEREAGFIYGEGIAPLYNRLSSSWREAEDEARRYLTFHSAGKIRSLRKSWNESLHFTADIQAVVRFRDIRTVARRWDNWADGIRVVVAVPETRVEPQDEDQFPGLENSLE